MRLKRLELQGFKSFLDRTILTFEPGITGVVGPNGCGKSNIVDAILWVMGEQSPKHLRGNSMSDIIFNGSDTKAAVSMAEVSLVLDREGVALPPQFAAFERGEEISITRRAYRDGTGEYLINKVHCRLRDIHELFMDTGVGRRAYSIIEQGQIDRMINVKPEERRLLFEEVAGITKYKLKRKEAEKKLELARQNILRLQDIVGELEKQIRSLKIQATKARKFREIKTELEVVDLFLLGRNLFTFQKKVAELAILKEQLSEQRAEAEAAFSQLDVEVSDLEIRRVEQEKAFQELSTRERDLSIEIQKFESRKIVLEERKRYLSQSSDHIVREENETGVKIEAMVADEELQRAERSALEESLETIESELNEQDTALREAHKRREYIVEQKQVHQEKLSQLSQREVYFQNQLHHGESREKEASRNQQELNQKLTDVLLVLEEHRTKLDETTKQIEAAVARSEEAEKEKSSLSTECRELSHELSEREQHLFKAREEFHAKNSRLESLVELQENLEGYSPTAREILSGLEGEAISAIPLAEVLQPAAEWEEQMELLLGPDMNTLVVPSSQEAERLAHLIEQRGLERVKVIALTDVRKPESASPPAGFTSLLDKLVVSAGYEEMVRFFLSDALLAPSSEQLYGLRNQYPQFTWLAPESKLICFEQGSIAGGNPPTKTGIFARKREIETLRGVCAETQALVSRLAAERESLLQQLKNKEELQAQVKDRLSQLHIESVEKRKERESIQVQMNRADRDYSSYQADSERNSAQLDQLRGQIHEWSENLQKIVADKEELLSNAKDTDHEMAAAAEQVEMLSDDIQEKKVERSRMGEKLNGLRYRIEKMADDIEQLRRRKESLVQQRAQEIKELDEIDGDIAAVQGERNLANETRNGVMVDLSDVKSAFNETCESLQHKKEEIGVLLRRKEAVGNELQQVELDSADERSRFENLRSIARERYQEEPAAIGPDAKLAIEQLPLLAETINVTWDLLLVDEQETLLREHFKNMKEKVDRYGEVNLTAIQEFDEVQKRYDFLMAQKTDLEKSISILEDTIKRIDESTTIRFEDTFHAVNKKFTEIFPILFNGGKAELQLTQVEGKTETGVEIMVQPPGKRLQAMTLLSGGEKALTAVSLVLAIFARRPSPFCLLDEVDAPLDDANVSRFNTVVKKMAEKTQFIVITHNKKTMEIAEALYGVTMERAGISKMTSVNMQTGNA